MFYSSQHKQYVREGVEFTLGDIQYPANWLNLSTAEEKAAIGLVEVKLTNSPADDRFYWVTETLEGTSLTYVNTPKTLDDYVDENVKVVGLKSIWITQIRNTAYNMLQPTDYIDIRNLRDPSYKPEWITWRDSVRATSTSSVQQITDCKTVDELATIIDGIVWPEEPAA